MLCIFLASVGYCVCVCVPSQLQERGNHADSRWLEERVQEGVRGGRSSCSPARCVIRLVQGPAVPVQAFKELKKGTAAGNAVTTAVKILEVDMSILLCCLY